MKKVIIIVGSVILVFLAIVGIVIWMFFAQYNINGVSHFLVVTVDKNVERKYVGKLDGYNVYVEGFKEYNLRTVDAKNLSVKEAIKNNLVSIDEWKKYAFGTKKDNDSLILLFDNYEIALTGDECLIKPKVH